MTQLITSSELEDISEAELYSKFCQILNDMARSQQSIKECPLARLSLENIQTSLRRRRLQGQKI
jgi:hypothetical protein